MILEPRPGHSAQMFCRPTVGLAYCLFPRAHRPVSESLWKRWYLVLGKTSRASAINEDDDGLDYEDQIAQPVEEVSTPATPGFGNAVSSLKEEEDPDLSYFAKLAEE